MKRSETATVKWKLLQDRHGRGGWKVLILSCFMLRDSDLSTYDWMYILVYLALYSLCQYPFTCACPVSCAKSFLFSQNFGSLKNSFLLFGLLLSDSAEAQNGVAFSFIFISLSLMKHENHISWSRWKTPYFQELKRASRGHRVLCPQRVDQVYSINFTFNFF